MLVLTRRVDESILIGNDVKVTLISIEGEKVRIGIDAPKKIRIFRQELVEETGNINKEALHTSNISFDLKNKPKNPK